MFMPVRAEAKEIRYNNSGTKEDSGDGMLSLSHFKELVGDTLDSVEEKLEELKVDASQETAKNPVAAKEITGKITIDSQTYPSGSYPVMGAPSVTVEQMIRDFEKQKAKYPAKALEKGGAKDIETFCQMFYDEAVAEGVKPEVAYAQAMKETGWLSYGGDATVEQFNFAGLGTTGGGVKGNAFPDVRTGIRAQVQHLKAYATTEPLNGTCVDERYEFVKKGCAPYVEWLGQQENPSGTGWATSKNYGYNIVDMIGIMRSI